MENETINGRRRKRVREKERNRREKNEEINVGGG